MSRLPPPIVAGALAVLLLAAACAGNAPRVAPPTTAPFRVDGTRPSTPLGSAATSPGATGATTPRTTDQWTADEQAVIDAYKSAMDAVLAAGQPPESNPDHPALAETMIDPQLSIIRAAAQGDKDAGLVFRERELSQRSITALSVSIDGDSADAEFCHVDDGLTVRGDTGEVVDDRVGAGQIRTVLTRTDRRWRLSERYLISMNEGVLTCEG